MATKLTDRQIKGLAPPATGSKIYYDAGFAGFGVRVTHGGHKSFVLNF